MATEINNTQLDLYCQACWQTYITGQPILAGLMECMYNLGLRSIEVLEPGRWILINSDQFQVTVAKNNALRVVQRSDVPIILQPYYINQAPLDYVTYSMLEFHVQKALPYIRPITNTKRTTSHIFRYNFCRRLYDEGYTPAQIKEIIKHYSQEVTDDYIFDVLELYGNVPYNISAVIFQDLFKLQVVDGELIADAGVKNYGDYGYSSFEFATGITRLMFTFPASGSLDYLIGFSSRGLTTSDNDIRQGIKIRETSYARIVNGAVSSPTPFSVYDKSFRLRTSGASVYFEYYDGNSWALLYTYPNIYVSGSCIKVQLFDDRAPAPLPQVSSNAFL